MIFWTLLTAFLSLVTLMIIHEFGHFIIARKFGVKVEEFGIGYPPRLYGKKFGETLYSINLIPLGAFVRIMGEEGGVEDYRSFSNLAIWKRVFIVLGGVIAFWLSAIIIFSFLFGLGASVPITDEQEIAVENVSLRIGAVAVNSPAESSGLKAGDIVLGLKDKDSQIYLNKMSDFQNFVQDRKGQEITLELLRNNKIVQINVIPRIEHGPNEGAVGVRLERIATIIQKYPWYLAPIQGLKFTWEVTYKSIVGIYGVFSNLFSGKGMPPGAELAGPVGITIFLANAANYGLGFFLYFIGSIAVLVAIFNLFPIPALDGGKLIFLLIEKIRKKPVPIKWEQIITVTFFFLLILMSIFVTVFFDIPRVMEFWRSAVQQ